MVHHHGTLLPGATAGDSRRDTEAHLPGDRANARAQIGTPLAGWFQFRPLWDQIRMSDPDLFNGDRSQQ